MANINEKPMNRILSLLLIITSININAQTTAIPDANFEQALIDLGYDTGVPDGSVITANINTIINLDISSKNISDLTGIEDFTALIDLKCTTNSLGSLNLSQNINLVNLDCTNAQLTSLNVTQNINLIELFCGLNQLTNIDITQNTLLSTVKCWSNLLTNIDVTQNPNLVYISCHTNQLSNLDISQNLSLQKLTCNDNQINGDINLSQHASLRNIECQNNLLNSLNVKNGTNNLFFVFDATNNPNLTCIEVDDTAWSASNWSIGIDGSASFSTNCSTFCNASSNLTYIDNGNGNYNFTNTSTGNFNQSHWAFGDGNTSVTTNSNHTFSANGTFVVALTINDSNNTTSCNDYYLDTIVVTGVPSPATCAAGFVIYPDTVTNDVTVVNSSTGNNLTYLWNFGDGSPTSSLVTPTHTYPTSGPFYLCLTVNDGAGCIDMYCDSVGENGVVFKTGGFTINVIASPIVTDIKDINLNRELTIFPNPTSTQLTFNSDMKVQRISITDITGKQVKSFIPNLNTIDVKDLSNGIYFIKLDMEGHSVIRKFVKQ